MNKNELKHILEKNFLGILQKIFNYMSEELAQINEVGSKMAESIVKYFKNTQVIDTINKLKLSGVNMKGSKKELIDNRFEGLTFVLTGTLPTYTREEASELIAKYGGKTASSVSKKTSYVLAGEEAGSKLQKAIDLGVTIIDDAEFRQFLR